MQSSLVALLSNMEFTENGMPTNKSSGSANLDFSYKIGGMRGRPEEEIVREFEKAWLEDPLLAMKNLFYTRDIRGGKGERRSSRIILSVLAKNHPDWILANMHLIPKYGRWDDLCALLDTANSQLVKEVTKFWFGALAARDGLAAKWLGRYGKSRWSYTRQMLVELFPSYRSDSPDNATVEAWFRRTVTKITKVVETQMSRNQWSEIDYAKVPSQANLKYRKAFYKHDEERYKKYLESVKKGEVKMHASTLQPHQIVEKVVKGDTSDALEAMWMSRPNYINPKFNPICMADVSGSMVDSSGAIYKALSIALDLSEHLRGFKNCILTFSQNPQLLVFEEGSSLADKVKAMYQDTSRWVLNTNVTAALDVLLNIAEKHNIPPEDFPTHVIIPSDMQFDMTPDNSGIADYMRKRYAGSKYKCPVIIFWNVRTSHGIPAEKDDRGWVMVSGYSTAVIRHVLGDEALVIPPEPTAMESFMLALEKYSDVVVPQKYLPDAAAIPSQ